MWQQNKKVKKNKKVEKNKKVKKNKKGEKNKKVKKNKNYVNIESKLTDFGRNKKRRGK